MKSFIKKDYLLITILMTLLLIIGVGTSFAYQLLKGDGSEKIDLGDSISYTLSADATEFQKTSFDELKQSLLAEEFDAYLTSGLIVKNFIADFYTWTNKQGSFDVGGLQYVYAPNTLYIQQEAKAYFYKDLSYLIEQYGAENLLQVESVNIKYVDPEQDYEYNGQMYTSYYVAAEWSYLSNSHFDSTPYQTKGYFSVLVRDNKYEIYRYYLE